MAGGVLRQNTGREAVILQRIRSFRNIVAPDPGCSLHRARLQSARRFSSLVEDTEREIVLRHEDVDRRHQEILDRYSVPADRSPGFATRAALGAANASRSPPYAWWGSARYPAICAVFLTKTSRT